MAILYSWTFPYLDVAPSEEGLVDVVKVIHWRYRLDDNGIFAEIFGSTGLDDTDGINFIPFEELTKSWAIQMLNNKMDVAQLQEALLQDVSNQKNPPIVTKPAPFTVSDN